MMEPLYTPGDTLLHRLPAGLKLGLLMAAGAGLFALNDARGLGLACLAAAGLVAVCRPRPARLWRQVRGLLLILPPSACSPAGRRGWRRPWPCWPVPRRSSGWPWP